MRAAAARLADVEVWVFDLDNTLYPASADLFAEIDARMTGFIEARLGLEREAAGRLRADYWVRHGATLAGLMREHGVDPHAFLEHVHAIDLGPLAPAPALAEALERLPGRKIVHTNGSRAHARRVTARLGVAAAFDGMFGIEDSGFTPKPAREAYERVLAAAGGVDPRRAAMIEDTARNLAAPHAMGMRTIWTRTGCPRAADGADGAHVEIVVEDHADDLAGFLAGVAAALRSSS